MNVTLTFKSKSIWTFRLAVSMHAVGLSNNNPVVLA